MPRWKIIDVTVVDVTTFPASAALTTSHARESIFAGVHNFVCVASRMLFARSFADAETQLGIKRHDRA